MLSWAKPGEIVLHGCLWDGGVKCAALGQLWRGAVSCLPLPLPTSCPPLAVLFTRHILVLYFYTFSARHKADYDPPFTPLGPHTCTHLPIVYTCRHLLHTLAHNLTTTTHNPPSLYFIPHYPLTHFTIPSTSTCGRPVTDFSNI